MRLVRPAGGDAGADGVAGPEIDDAGGVGVVADGIAGAARDGGRGGADFGRGAAARGRPARGAAVLRRGIAAQRVPGIAKAPHHLLPSREKLAKVTLGRRAAAFSAACRTDSARPSSSSERYSTVRPSKVTRVVPPVKAAASDGGAGAGRLRQRPGEDGRIHDAKFDAAPASQAGSRRAAATRPALVDGKKLGDDRERRLRSSESGICLVSGAAKRAGRRARRAGRGSIRSTSMAGRLGEREGDVRASKGDRTPQGR